MEKKPIKEIVKNKEWQDIRRSFLGTWKATPQKNCARLRGYLGGMNDITKIRIVQNYLTGTGFRLKMIDHPCINKLRKDLSEARKKYKTIHTEQKIKNVNNEQILKNPMNDITIQFEKTLAEFRENFLFEQDDPSKEKEDDGVPAEEEQADPQEMQQGMDPSMAQQQGMDPSMMGMGQNIDPATGLPIPEPEFIGRIYEMNKIYYFLKSMDNLLLRIPTNDTIKLRNLVSKTIDLFELVVDNLPSYKDQIDDIIVMFYRFLKRLSAVMEKYYNSKKIEQKQKDKQQHYGEEIKES